jgi:hypothetical protein
VCVCVCELTTEGILVLTATNVKITVIQDVGPCSLADSDERFRSA